MDTMKNKATQNMNSKVLSTLSTKLEAPENISQVLSVNIIEHRCDYQEK